MTRPNSLKKILRRGHRKLRVCAYSSEKTKSPIPFICHWKDGIVIRLDSKASTIISWLKNKIKKKFTPGRLIRVRVNLGQDESLTSRDVLFNTATLLHQQLHDQRKYTGLIPFAIIVLLATWMTEKYLGGSEWFSEWLSKLLRNSNLPDWLNWLNLPSPINALTNSELFFGAGFTVVVYHLWTRYFPTSARILHLLERLNKRIAYTVEFDKGVQHGGISFSRKETQLPLDARQIETELLHILKECRKVPRGFGKLDIVFVFDELDKIVHRPLSDDGTPSHASVGSDLHERKKKVDDLLGTLKNFITHGEARFFFIAGREMLDSY